MSIKEIIEKINPFYSLFLFLVVALIFFGLGRLSVVLERHSPIKIENLGISQAASVIKATSLDEVNIEEARLPALEAAGNGGQVIGSKSGKKYYFPWCGTVKRIKPENQVPFPSIEAARAAGFTPAQNCKGLK